MIISDYNIYFYKLIFKTEFKTSAKNYTSKKGFLLRLKSSSGNESFGDYTNLNEFLTQQISTADNEIVTLLNEIKDKSINSLQEIQNIVKRIENNFPAQHCLSQALLNLYAKENDTDLIEKLGLEFNSRIELNSVIGLDSVDKTLEVFSNHINQGYKTVKLKLGRLNFSDDILLLKKIRQYFDNDIKLRLDINAAWSMHEARIKLKELSQFKIEYIEQPLDNLTELIELSNVSPIKVAADESLRDFKNAEILMNSGTIDYFVLKPSLFGSLLDSIKLIRLAEDKNIKVIISSAFESEIGYKDLIMLASICKNKTAHGLSTFTHIKDFDHSMLFDIESNFINIPNKSVFNS